MLKKVRASEEFKSLPVIVITSAFFGDMIKNAIAAAPSTDIHSGRRGHSGSASAAFNRSVRMFAMAIARSRIGQTAPAA